MTTDQQKQNLASNLTREQKQRNLLEHFGINPITAARWYALINCDEWPKDFPIAEPENYHLLSEPRKLCIALIVLHGIEDMVPREIKDAQWMGLKCRTLEDGSCEYSFPDESGNMEVVHIGTPRQVGWLAEPSAIKP